MPGSTELDGKSAFFTEEQRLLQGWRWGPLVFAVAVMAFVLWPQEGAGRPPVGGWPALAGSLGALVGLLVVTLLFVLKLSVRITDSHVQVNFFPLRSRSIPMAEITSCEVRRYRPMIEYGGWGIRLGPRGWAYTVSGREGVQLEFRKGRGLLIGSKRAAELAAAIQRGMGGK